MASLATLSKIIYQLVVKTISFKEKQIYEFPILFILELKVSFWNWILMLSMIHNHAFSGQLANFEKVTSMTGDLIHPFLQILIISMCGSRKYPDLHHGGNWKFQGSGGIRGPGNSRGEGGWTIKSLSGGKYHFIFDLSSNIASYRTVRSFLEHK